MESWPWKRDLGLVADRLEEARFGLSEVLDLHGYESEECAQAFYQLERDVMAGAFATRRLIGMPSKVTQRARTSSVNVTRFALREGAKSPDLWDVLSGLDMYLITAPMAEEISATELCNLFVHSLIFRPAWTANDLAWDVYSLLPVDDPRAHDIPTELAGLLVASDKSRSQHLTFVGLTELVRAFRVLVNDEVTVVESRTDRRGRTHMTAR